MNHDDIKDFFHQNRPPVNDEGTYLTELKARLDAIEEIKRIHDIEVSRCKRIAIAASACGIALGAILMAVIVLCPIPVPKLYSAILASAAAFIAQWKELLVAGIAVSALALGLAPWGKADRKLL